MTTVAEQQVDAATLRRSLIGGSIGVLVHWYEWAIYAYLASTIAVVFFPEKDATAGLLATFGVFAVSFALRPIGAFVFGHLGDRIGRKTTLTVVILMMSGATFILGLLPSYGTIGLLAPILLIVCRLVQGLAAGGEFGSAAAYMAEYSPRRHRGFGVSWIEVGSLMGFLLASLTVVALNAFVTDDQIHSWGWRIPFLITGVLGVIGFYIRQRLEDTPEFQELEEKDKAQGSPVKEVLRRHPRQLLQAAGMQILMNVTFYVVLVYLLSFQESELGYTAGDAATFSTVASIVAMILVPLVGALSDRVGRKPVMITGGVLLLVLAIPAFLLMRNGTYMSGMLATCLLAALLTLSLGVHASAAAELFPTRARQSGLSISYSLTAAIFVGTVPYVLTWLIAATGNTLMPAFYLMGAAVLGLLALATMPETRGADLSRVEGTR
ncbi:MFS transporter [Amycolatopsis taiwanensis]|uniref:Putative proline/betaine transporter n=1 Tax=Amycolatopsis taiwanensis TaxID=342230 RepID=A0A9W6VIH3_9PSEU|nr:MFS transporter [Amycolatopsis taiwanensis]GLY69695.1 MFS transporter [Amycolatopsis taiwanensis]